MDIDINSTNSGLATSPREILLILESEGQWVFHGSEDLLPADEMFDPQQAYTFDGNIKIKDDKPAVHASPFADIAILMALINKKNCPAGYDSGFEYTDALHVSASQTALDQLDEKTAGYVYVFAKDNFVQRSPSQSIAYLPVLPIESIRVTKTDLSPDLEVL